MSQAGQNSSASGPVNPIVATSYVTDLGTATPAVNIMNIKAKTGGVSNGNTVSFIGSSNLIQLQVTDVNNNIMFGKTAGNATLTGANNLGFGVSAGSAYSSTEASNIAIGNIGTALDANTTRIGTQGTGTSQQNKCFIAGITGSTVSGASVLCSTAGQLGTISSSIRYKENVEDVEESIIKLRPVKFNYIGLDHKVYGLIAEEVDETFPDLCIYDDEGKPESVKYHEMAALLLKEIQVLSARIDKLEEKQRS